MKKSIHNSSHYTWGDNCTGWPLVNTKDLSVKQEQMPPKTSEKIHFHHTSQQFFYILNGIATIRLNQKLIRLEANEGILIKSGTKHQIQNNSDNNLDFLVISQPNTFNDRIEENF